MTVLEAQGYPSKLRTDAVVEEKFSHPAWRAFVSYCIALQHGEIEILKIQDGLPVLAEVTKKKIKFT